MDGLRAGLAAPMDLEDRPREGSVKPNGKDHGETRHRANGHAGANGAFACGRTKPVGTDLCRWLAGSAFIRRATPDGLQVTSISRGSMRPEGVSEIDGVMASRCLPLVCR
jgi:hypothetical protein